MRDYDRAARPLAAGPRRRVVEQADNEGGARELKSGGAQREVPAHPVLCTFLEEWLFVGFPAMYGRQPGPTDYLGPSRRGPSIPRKRHHMVNKLVEELERLGLRRKAQHDSRRSFISLMQEDGADPKLVAAITHYGMATETRGVFRGYSVWGWNALCRAMRDAEDSAARVDAGGSGGTRRARIAHVTAAAAGVVAAHFSRTRYSIAAGVRESGEPSVVSQRD